MEGKYSNSSFFKLYPSIIQSFFQGSKTTTPEEVEGIFNIAEDKLKKLKERDKKENDNTDLPISMILFDELGLAERSESNPLKVLHSHLERDGNKKNISFIGISNWTLDAAKTNRALTLSVPDLDSDLDDLKMTSQKIAESVNEDFGNRELFKKILPNVYFYFKRNLKLLKELTVYKEYKLQEYKNILEEYKEDKEFQKLFENQYKDFFVLEKREKRNYDKKIFEYETYKSMKNKIEEFLGKEEIKIGDKEKKYPKFEVVKKNMILKDKKVKDEFLGNRDFYYLIKGIAYDMESKNNEDLIRKNIERNFGGLEIIIDFEKDYSSIDEFSNFDSKGHEFRTFDDELVKLTKNKENPKKFLL